MTLEQPQSLTALGRILLADAEVATSGRTARTVYGDHSYDLRQTLIALAAGRSLGEHEAPGEATLQVLVGTVRLTAGDLSWTTTEGDLLPIPDHRHDLHAETAAVVLLTVATRGDHHAAPGQRPRQ